MLAILKFWLNAVRSDHSKRNAATLCIWFLYIFWVMRFKPSFWKFYLLWIVIFCITLWLNWDDDYYDEGDDGGGGGGDDNPEFDPDPDDTQKLVDEVIKRNRPENSKSKPKIPSFT